MLFGPQMVPPSDPTSDPTDAPWYNSPTDNNIPGVVGDGSDPSQHNVAPQLPSDWLACAKAYGVNPVAASSSSTELEVYIPEDAVSGPVYVVHPDGTVLKSPGNFQVFSFRNSFGFSFANNSGEVNGQQVPDGWQDFSVGSDLMGAEFSNFASGVGWSIDNPVDPTGVTNFIWWAICQALDNHGACFGMEATASLIYQEFWSSQAGGPFAVGPVTDLGQTPDPSGSLSGSPTINFSNGGSAPVFSLAWSSNLSIGGTTDPLLYMIKVNHLAQMSTYAVNTAADQWTFDHTASAMDRANEFIGRVASELEQGRPPIIGVNDAHHALLAYDLQSDGNGGWWINVYNPNDPVNAWDWGKHDVAQSSNQNNVPGWDYLVQTQAGMRGGQSRPPAHGFQGQLGLVAERRPLLFRQPL